MNRNVKKITEEPYFSMPPLNTSATSVLKKLRKFIFLYGASKANLGALEVSLNEWFKRRDGAVVVDVPYKVGLEPVLFYESFQSSDPQVTIDLIFTAEHIYRPVMSVFAGRLGEMKIASVAKVSLAELVSFEQLIPGFGQSLAQDMQCLLWRIEHNPKDYGVSDE